MKNYLNNKLINLNFNNKKVNAIKTSEIPITKIIFNQSTISMNIGDTFVLVATIEPSNATDKTLEWMSISNNISISPNENTCLVEALESGVAEISVFNKNKTISSTCSILISEVAPTSDNLLDNATYKDGYRFNGTNTDGSPIEQAWAGNCIMEFVAEENKKYKVSYNNYTYSSWFKGFYFYDSNKTYLGKSTSSFQMSEFTTVSGTKYVKASAIETLTNFKTYNVSIGSTSLVSSVTFDRATLYINPNVTKVISATVLPITANIKTLTWSSSNTSIATVDSNGNVKGVALGNCVITATSQDGSNKKATCNVIVENVYVPTPPPDGLTIDQAMSRLITELQSQYDDLYAQDPIEAELLEIRITNLKKDYDILTTMNGGVLGV